MAAPLDKDTPLKERVARVLLTQGFVARFNVDVLSFSAPAHKGQVTDLDVLAVRYDELLRPERLVIDCKSGTNTSTKERMFWLHGVRTRYGARRAIFVRAQGDPSSYASDYRQLDLSMLSNETLETHERMNEVVPFEALAPYPVGVATDHESALAPLKTGNKNVHRYLTAGYWNDSTGAQLDSLVDIVIPGTSAMARGLALGLLGQTIVSLVGEVVQYPPGKWAEATRLSTSGAMNLQSQEQLLGTFYEFMAQELKAKTGKKWDVPKESFVRGLDRAYLTELVELVQRLAKNPSTRLLPQAIDIAAYGLYCDKNSTSLHAFPWMRHYAPSVHRAFVDFLTFVGRTTNLPDAERSALADALTVPAPT